MSFKKYHNLPNSINNSQIDDDLKQRFHPYINPEDDSSSYSDVKKLIFNNQ